MPSDSAVPAVLTVRAVPDNLPGMTEDLADLRWHWGSAYVITCYRGQWIAARTDNHIALVAESAHELRQLIQQDYSRCPVPR